MVYEFDVQRCHALGALPLPVGERVGVRGLPVVKGNTGRARRLRRDQTNAERTLWFRLRDRRLDGWKFKRQIPIDRFVVDFCCADAKLILEIDGGQHDQDRERDADRTRILEAMGYLVLRSWNNDVLRNTEGVLEEILSVLNRQRL
jgi:very-short-patch-repair endonuclease